MEYEGDFGEVSEFDFDLHLGGVGLDFHCTGRYTVYSLAG